MDPELIDMIQEQLQSFRDEDKLRAMTEACNELLGEEESTCLFFLMGCVYGSCNFILDSYVPKNRKGEIKLDFKNMLYTNMKGLEYIFKEYLK